MELHNKTVPLARPSITNSEIDAVAETLRSGYLTTGPKVREFESEFAQYLGGGVFAAAVSSCSAGLYLSLVAYGIGEGDEVIVPTWTFAATAHVVLWTGAKVVLCDVEPASLNIDIRGMERLISAKTKAVLPVHFAGYPCEMGEIIRIARAHRLRVIEDAAHAAGSCYKGTKIGHFGDATVFSFYATKNLTCGEGGMVVSNEEAVIEKIRKLSYFGIQKSKRLGEEAAPGWYYEIESLGYKYNMDSIHAAIGLVQLRRLDEMNEKRRRIAKLYRENLDPRIQFTEDLPEHYHTYHLFPIRLRGGAEERNRLVTDLKAQGIETSVHYIPLHRHPYYRSQLNGRSFPVADQAYEEIVSIPLFPDMSDEDVFYVIETINGVLKA